jgi:transcription elongation factor Elf1
VGVRLTQFKKHHLLCPMCNNSSWRLAIHEDVGVKRVILDCAACNDRSEIPVEGFDRSVKQRSRWAYLNCSDEADVEI